MNCPEEVMIEMEESISRTLLVDFSQSKFYSQVFKISLFKDEQGSCCYKKQCIVDLDLSVNCFATVALAKHGLAVSAHGSTD
jgi:hypothetical protein